MDTFPGFRSIVVNQDEVRELPYLDNHIAMINKAYAFSCQNSELFDGAKILRLPSKESFINLIGKHGRYCIAYRDDDEEMASPVAIAGIKFFSAYLDITPVKPSPRGEGYDEEPNDFLSVRHWEPKCVAVAADSSLKKKGLATHCLAKVEGDILERLDEARSNEGGSESKGDDLTFWVRATVGDNSPYWQRRGYECHKVELFPKGSWASIKEFEVMTLKRAVPRRTCRNGPLMPSIMSTFPT